MDISEYRARFASFNSALELVRFHEHAGLRSQLSRDEVYDSHRDLFSLDAIAELKALREQVPASQETQRSGLSKLISAAAGRFAEQKAADLARELERCERAASIEWRGETLALDDVSARLGREPEKDLRRDLYARWLDAILECHDLRCEQLAALNESAKAAGFESFLTLTQESDRSSSDAQAAINSLLKQTESSYNAALGRVLSGEIQGLARDELEAADLPYLSEIHWLDNNYPASESLRISAETMNGLGIRADQQRQIQIDSEPRSARKRGSACFPIAPPHDVRVALLPLEGTAAFSEVMESYALAQFFAWCSPDLSSRNPEFIYPTDQATSRSYAYLFRYLSMEARWNLEFVPRIDERKAAAITRAAAFHLALQARRLSAASLCASEDLSDETAGKWERLFEEAIAMRVPASLVMPGLLKAEQPLTKLRALAFSAVLREHLRVRFGRRWWSSRKAGDELVDLWSTSSRHSVEELSSLLGFGELSFDLLAEAINSGLTGD